MDSALVTETDGTKPNPPLFGSLAYLVLNLPIGIASFTFVVTAVSLGVSTAIIWVGVPVLMLAVLVWRGAAMLERQRVHVMLGTYIASPYRPLPEGLGNRWKARLKEGATWKDMVYFLLLLPIGVAEFTLMVSFWSASVWLLSLPLTYNWFPSDWHPVLWDWPMRVDSTWEALPWAAVGALLLVVTAALTKGLGTLHARFARAMLGPNPRKLAALARPTSANVPNWDFRTHAYPGM